MEFWYTGYRVGFVIELGIGVVSPKFVTILVTARFTADASKSKMDVHVAAPMLRNLYDGRATLHSYLNRTPQLRSLIPVDNRRLDIGRFYSSAIGQANSLHSYLVISTSIRRIPSERVYKFI